MKGKLGGDVRRKGKLTLTPMGCWIKLSSEK
jgi:hypothetical protein